MGDIYGYFEAVMDSASVVLIAIGIVLNVVLLVVFIRHPETRNPESVPLVNLCLTDIMYLLLCLLCTVFEYYAVTGVVCLFLVFFRGFAIALNAYTVAAISVQRYIGLFRIRNTLPGQRPSYVPPLLILVGIWTLAAILTATEVIVLTPRFRDFNCRFTIYVGHSSLRFVAYGIVPTVITTVFCIATGCRLRWSIRQIPGVQCNTTLEELQKRRRRSSRLLFALAAVFVLTYLPFFMLMWILRSGELEELLYLLPVSTMSSILNSIFNPIALCFAGARLGSLCKEYYYFCYRVCFYCYFCKKGRSDVELQQNTITTTKEDIYVIMGVYGTV